MYLFEDSLSNVAMVRGSLIFLVDFRIGTTSGPSQDHLMSLSFLNVIDFRGPEVHWIPFFFISWVVIYSIDDLQFNIYIIYVYIFAVQYMYIFVDIFVVVVTLFLNINFHLKVGAQQTRFFFTHDFHTYRCSFRNRQIARWKLPNLETSWGWRWCDGPPGEWSHFHDLWNARDSCVQKKKQGVALDIITSLWKNSLLRFVGKDHIWLLRPSFSL